MPYAITFQGRAFTPSGAADFGPEQIEEYNRAVEASQLAHIATAPAEIMAYVGDITPDNHMRRDLALWTGAKIGTCRLTSSWPIQSYIGSRMYQIHATVAGVAYTGRGFGTGMIVRLRKCKCQPR